MMKKRPNILFILSDDQGAWAMHCAGTPELHTPNLDRLANEGMRFENFFCVSPVCSPARASILTGNIPSAHGVHDWLRSGNVDREKFLVQGDQNPYGHYVDEDRPIQYLSGQRTYTDVLSQNGYRCALSGKWHLGDSIHPQHGFDMWYTIGKGGCFYYKPDIVENGDIHLDDRYVTTLITDKALEFMDELRQDTQPFYLSVHYTAPHSPWGAEHHPKEYIERYEHCKFESIPDVPDHPDITVGKVAGTPLRHENLRGYFAAITAMDHEIGRLLDHLEACGLREDTLVVFTADNGMNMGHHGIWGKGNGTFPLNMFDTSVKVPFILSYPGFTQSGSICRNMVSAYDIFPTLLDILGMEDPVTARLPGHSFAPLLRGEKREDDGAVVVFDEYGPVRMIRTTRYKYIHRYPYGYHEFYDLQNDPGEEHNLIDDPSVQSEILKMRRQMEKWFADYVNPDIDGTREGVTGFGQLCSPGIYAQKIEKYYEPKLH